MWSYQNNGSNASTLTIINPASSSDFTSQGAPPTAPSAGLFRMYVDTSGLVRMINSDGISWSLTDGGQF